MKVKTAIEVKRYGDYDVLYTVCIMVHENKMKINDVLNEFFNLKGIGSNVGLDYTVLGEITEEFIVFLEDKGFKELKTKQIYFGD